MFAHAVIISLLLASTALALPRATDTSSGSGGKSGDNNTYTSITAATIVAIMPDSASCTGQGDECATAALAAPYLGKSLDDYGVASAYERAGVLALMAYESVQLRYRTNSNAEEKAKGRGTANQQSGDFNVQYANTFEELKSLGLTAATVLRNVTADQYNFATGAWYYANQATSGCEKARTVAQQSTTNAWQWFSGPYLTDCVGVNITAQTERTTYWNNALDAFGLTNDTTN